ncbi:hypothetical protein [Luteimonas sp. TWI1437]
MISKQAGSRELIVSAVAHTVIRASNIGIAAIIDDEVKSSGTCARRA